MLVKNGRAADVDPSYILKMNGGAMDGPALFSLNFVNGSSGNTTFVPTAVEMDNPVDTTTSGNKSLAPEVYAAVTVSPLSDARKLNAPDDTAVKSVVTEPGFGSIDSIGMPSAEAEDVNTTLSIRVNFNSTDSIMKPETKDTFKQVNSLNSFRCCNISSLTTAGTNDSNANKKHEQGTGTSAWNGIFPPGGSNTTTKTTSASSHVTQSFVIPTFLTVVLTVLQALLPVANMAFFYPVYATKLRDLIISILGPQGVPLIFGTNGVLHLIVDVMKL